MICPACSSENQDGSVFCNTCGKRMVVAYSDINTGGYSAAEEEPLYETRWMGLEVSVSRDWLMVWSIPVMLVVFAFGIILIAAGLSGALGPEAVYSGIVVLLFVLLCVLRILYMARKYRTTGRPIDFGGSGESPPPASSVMVAEDDTRKRDMTPPGEDDRPSRSERTLIRR